MEKENKITRIILRLFAISMMLFLLKDGFKLWKMLNTDNATKE